MLTVLDGGPVPSVVIDTMRHPYAQLSQTVVWPAVTVTGIEPVQQERVANVLAQQLPGFVQGCNLLPEPRPRRESHQVQFVRLHEFEDQRFLYIFRVSAGYMGGAANTEIVAGARQGISPSFQTDKVYFSARLLPVREVRVASYGIVDFEAHQLADAEFLFRERTEGQTLEVFTTSLFDEIDFGKLEQSFLEQFSFGTEWTGGKTFRPFVIDYLTLALNLVVPEPGLVEQIGPHFARAFAALRKEGTLATLPESEKQFWRKYFAAWAYENRFSRGGNPQWALIAYPDPAWRNAHC